MYTLYIACVHSVHCLCTHLAGFPREQRTDAANIGT
jgi:hypothetical protein